MATIRRAREAWKHPSWTYRSRALTHGAQSAVVAAPMVVGFATLSIVAALAAVVAAELFVLVILPHLPGFRRTVDACIERASCARAAASRTVLFARMWDGHRRELEQLEDLAARVRAASGTEGEGDEEWLGFDHLLAAYVKLAIAHRENAIAFHPACEAQLDVQIADLERRRVDATGDVAACVARRLQILRDRYETWQRARYERSLLEEELATIAELVRWMYEQAALGRSGEAHAGIADAIENSARNGPVLREVAAALSVDPGVDLEVLKLGRTSARGPAAVAPAIAGGSRADARLLSDPACAHERIGAVTVRLDDTACMHRERSIA